MGKQTARLFYVPPDSVRGNTVLITGKEVHHIEHVLRLKPGDQLHVFDGCGNAYLVEISGRKARSQLQAAILAPLDKKTPQSINLTLAQSIPQKQIFDRIVAKSTELGIQCIVPLLSGRTVNKFSEAKKEKILDRWHTISIQAAKQSKQYQLPIIEYPQTVAQLLTRLATFDVVLAATPDNAEPARAILERIRLTQPRGKPWHLLVIIGPEGGFTPQERALIQGNNVFWFSLGDTILKTDTAMIAAISVIKNFL